jgi:16S rRNA (guanine527-N7)-methyltransferase
VLNPQRRFTLIDSNGKKIRFVQHAARTLGLSNVEGLHGRAETIKGRTFDTVVARAFAPLPELVGFVSPLCGPQTQVLAMKGKWPQSEVDGLPPQWLIQGIRELAVPGLNESRCVLVLRRPAVAGTN